MNGRKFPNWDPRTESTLSVAYNEALQRARDLRIETDKVGQPVSDALVDYIVAQANQGIFDPKTLVDGALKSLQRD
jgi:hypothetical protein